MSKTYRTVNMTKAIKTRTMNIDNKEETNEILNDIFKKIKRLKNASNQGIVADGTLNKPVFDFEGKPKFGVNEKKNIKKQTKKEDRIKRKQEEAEILEWANNNGIEEENEPTPKVWQDKLISNIPTWIFGKMCSFLKKLNETHEYDEEELTELVNIIEDL